MWVTIGATTLVIVIIVASILVLRQSVAQQCESTNTNVRLTPDSDEYLLAGQLCWQGSLQGKVVQVLIPGFSYDRNYWDIPYQPQTYSYVRAANNAGYATLNIDRVGTGQSSRPADPASLTVQNEAYMVHQVVAALHTGKIASTPFTKVVLVGHSLGAAIALYTAANYSGIEGVVLSGTMTKTNAEFLPKLAVNYFPANQDPKFKDLNLPDAYLTTKPGTRGASFYNVDYAKKEVIDVDEATKQTGTPTERATIAVTRDPNLTKRVRVPVLLTVGSKDLLFCNDKDTALSCANDEAVMNREKDNYSPQACLEAFALQQSGHDMNLHPNAQDWYKRTNDWLAKRVGKTAKDAPAQACR